MKQENFRVFTNFSISIDGKISTKDRAHIDPSAHDRYMMDVNRGRAHAVLMGANTLRSFRRPAVIERRRLQLLRRARGLNPQPINVILCRRPDFDPSWPFFTDPRIERVIVAPEATPESALKPFHSLAHIFRYERDADYPEQVIGYLRKLGCRNLLIEGGGAIMFPWVESDLIDEWNVTVCPKVMGGEKAPTMVEGNGFDAAHVKSYRLAKSFKRRDEMFLRYVRR